MKAESTLDLFPSGYPTQPSLELERVYWTQGLTLIAGVDEAGRGCLSGPVVAAAVIFPVEHKISGVRDSKSITKTKRSELADTIRSEAVAVSTGMCSPSEIDSMNILQAALEAMRRAIVGLAIFPEHVLIDGNMPIPNPPVASKTVIKGDARSHSIAAASIIAKTTRDTLMLRLHDTHPAYGWNTNMGYPTPGHYQALAEHGPTPHHRRSFRLF